MLLSGRDRNYLHPMPPGRFLRLLLVMRVRALLLLALFLGAGTSLPSLDAVLFHGHGAERFAGDTHLDPAGGCGGHADHCTLGRTPAGSRSLQPWAVEIHVASTQALLAVPALVSRAIASSLRTLPRPRAPPALRIA